MKGVFLRFIQCVVRLWIDFGVDGGFGNLESISPIVRIAGSTPGLRAADASGNCLFSAFTSPFNSALIGGRTL